jgi:hypothetical protein
MINPKELRLGNIVNYTRNLPGEDKYYTVLNILPTDLVLQSSTDHFIVDIKDVYPVLLTNQIFPLCSFDPLNTEPQNRWYHNTVKGFGIDEEVDSENDLVYKWYIYAAGDEFTYLESVHQLQNLFFALYGKELQTRLIQ